MPVPSVWGEEAVKRTPLRRRTPPKRGRKAIRTNPTRLHKRRGGPPGTAERHTYGAYHGWVASQGCVARGFFGHRCIGRTCGHHLRSIGAGGRDYQNEVGVCAQAHSQLHSLGRRLFEEHYGLDLEAEAIRLAFLYDGGCGST